MIALNEPKHKQTISEKQNAKKEQDAPCCPDDIDIRPALQEMFTW